LLIGSDPPEMQKSIVTYESHMVLDRTVQSGPGKFETGLYGPVRIFLQFSPVPIVKDQTVEVRSSQVGIGPQSGGAGLYSLVFFAVSKKGSGPGLDQTVASLSERIGKIRIMCLEHQTLICRWSKLRSRLLYH
jgi:hypothetical protein